MATRNPDPRKLGGSFDVYILSGPSDPETVLLASPLVHDARGAWTQGQRYTSVKAAEERGYDRRPLGRGHSRIGTLPPDAPLLRAIASAVHRGRHPHAIGDKIAASFFDQYRYQAAPSEVASWKNSLSAMANVVRHGALTDHGVVVEWQLP